MLSCLLTGPRDLCSLSFLQRAGSRDRLEIPSGQNQELIAKREAKIAKIPVVQDGSKVTSYKNIRAPITPQMIGVKRQPYRENTFFFRSFIGVPMSLHFKRSAKTAGPSCRLVGNMDI